MKKKRILLSLLAAGAALSLAACGANSTTDDNNTTNNNNTSTGGNTNTGDNTNTGGNTNDGGNTAAEATVESLTVTGGARAFTIGDDFSADGLTVIANMSDNTTETVIGYDIDSSKVDKTKEGTYKITISFSGKTVDYEVTYTYSTVLASITITGADAETYEYGKSYSPASTISYKLVYTDGHSVDLADSSVLTYSLSNADKNGNKTCTVKYGDITASYTVAMVKNTPAASAAGKISMNGTEYATITEAFAAIPTNSTEVYTIVLGKGTYNENGITYNGSATVRLIGSTEAKYGSDVIIKGHGSKMPGETGCDSRNRCLISIQGSASIILENLTLESDWSRAEHSGDVQAEVLGTDTTGNTAAYNCSFKSHQDTLRTIGKAWFYGCYIEGDVDFIWMEAGGKVALYEECEIVSVYDAAASTHNTYLTAPKMGETMKLGKGLVIYNSTVRESDEAREKGQRTYLARTPWSSGCYNQVTYINTTCSDIETTSYIKADGKVDPKSTNAPWYGTQIATPYAVTTVGWKMDKATAESIGLTDLDSKDYILGSDAVATEYSGRTAILNRIYDTGKLKYVSDSSSNWDINAVIAYCGWNVTEDTSSDKLEGETMGEATVYNFKVEGVEGVTLDGFTYQKNGNNTHYVGQSGATITVPVSGKCFVEVYGYFAGSTVITCNAQVGKQIAFFNNNTTNNEVENDYIVYNADATSITITSFGTTYITKIVVISDESIEDVKVTDVTITNIKPLQIVGVPQKLSTELGPKGVINTSVEWSTSDETIAKVDKYTGKVTFLAEGKVTITATACDGSGVSDSVEFNPIIPTWTKIEWYTTDDDVVAETGADGADMFDTNNSTYKSIGTEYAFTNMAGETISTKYGLKLNSSGMLSFATLKYAEVELIIAPKQNQVENAPNIINEDGTKAELLSKYVDPTTKVQYYTYALTATGLWNIERSDYTTENNPIIYAKVEYKAPTISTSTGITFKGSHYTTSKTGIESIVTPGSAIDATDTTIELNKMQLTNCASNGSADNWLRFNTGAKIEFTVSKSTTLLVGYYSKLQTIKLDGVVIEGNKTSVYSGAGEIVEYEIPNGGVVTIEATANDYLGFVGVLFKTLDQKKTEACNSLDSLYPASKYTKNADYATVLAAQKDAINAATEDTLASVVAAAKTALDALEQDPVAAGPVKYLTYVYSEVASGTTVESTDQITFAGCINHNGGNEYIALKESNSVSIQLAAGAVLTVDMPYTNGTVSINGTEYTLAGSPTEQVVYTATTEGIYVLTGPAGNAYITKITVALPLSSLDYVFVNLADKPADSTPVESFDGVTFTNCVAHNGQYVALKNNNEVKIFVAKGAVLTVDMPYSSGITLNGADYTLVDNKLTYTATADEYVVITGAAGNAYIEKISIAKPLSYLKYEFKSLADKPADGAAVESFDGVTFTNCVAHNGQYVALKDNNEVKIFVAKGTVLTVDMPYSNGITLNGEAYTLVNNKLTYAATADGYVVITGAAGNAYITKITVEIPLSTLNYVFVDLENKPANGAAAESFNGVTFTNCVAHNGQYVALKDNNEVKILVAAGKTLTVDMPYSSGITLNGADYTLADNKLTYTATADEYVVITGAAGNAYIEKITIE